MLWTAKVLLWCLSKDLHGVLSSYIHNLDGDSSYCSTLIFHPAELAGFVYHLTSMWLQLMGVAYLRDTAATTLWIILTSSEAGKGWSYRTRVTCWHASGYFSVLGLGLWVLRGKGDL